MHLIYSTTNSETQIAVARTFDFISEDNNVKFEWSFRNFQLKFFLRYANRSSGYYFNSNHIDNHAIYVWSVGIHCFRVSPNQNKKERVIKKKKKTKQQKTPHIFFLVRADSAWYILPATSDLHQVPSLLIYLRCTEWFCSFAVGFQESRATVIIQFLTFFKQIFSLGEIVLKCNFSSMVLKYL